MLYNWDTYTHTHTHNRFTALWNLSGTTWVSRYQKKHSPTHTHRGHQSSQSAFSIYEPWHPPYSIHVLCSFFPQSLFKFSLVYLLVWYPPLHTPYISSPNHFLKHLQATTKFNWMRITSCWNDTLYPVSAGSKEPLGVCFCFLCCGAWNCNNMKSITYLQLLYVTLLLFKN